MNVKDKVAIVTGASSGIGLETARLLASEGATVVAVARREERLQTLAAEMQQHTPDSGYIAGDMSDKAFVENMVAQAVARHGRVDILVNNAGIPMHRLIYKISAEDAENVMQVNFYSCLWACFAAIPHMLKQGGGTLVNVSSFGSIVPPTHESIYVASKGAMNGFTRGLWNDLRGSGIHAVLLHPGPIATEIWGKLDEPGAYSGEVFPPELVAKDILRAIEKQQHEVISPNTIKLRFARWMSFIAPSLVRKGVANMDPVKADDVERARRHFDEGAVRLGEL